MANDLIVFLLVVQCMNKGRINMAFLTFIDAYISFPKSNSKEKRRFTLKGCKKR